jgi:hypothetical protein
VAYPGWKSDFGPLVVVFFPVKMSRARQVVFCRLVQYLPDGEALRSASLLLQRRTEQAQLSRRWSEAQRMGQRLMGACQRMLLVQLLKLWLLLQLLKLWLLLLQLLKRESGVMVGVVCS